MAKLERATRIYVRTEINLTSIPAWRIVNFPNETVFVYPSLEQASNGRIISRAFAKFREINLKKHGIEPDDYPVRVVGWSAFARYLNYCHLPKVRNSIGGAISNKIYGNVQRGTLPRDKRVRQMLIELSGWPWE